MGKYRRTGFVVWQLVLMLFLAVVGKVAFLGYNAGNDVVAVSDVWAVLRHGFVLDFATATFLLLPAWVTMMLLRFKKGDVHLRRYVTPYLSFIMFLVVLETFADMVMYSHWKFKLDASIFGYMFDAGEVGSSVSTWYIVSRAIVLVLSVAAFGIASYRLTPRILRHDEKERTDVMLARIIIAMATAISILPGANDESRAFHSDRILLSHAAVNPFHRFAASAWLYSKPLDRQFVLMEEARRDSIFREMFPQDTEDIGDTLLTTMRPNILTLQLEGCGAPLIEALGGLPGVTPELCRWMQKGVNFDNAWASSFRTDRGTVSVISGYVSYPTTSLMLRDECLPKLPSLAQSLRNNGYSAEYLYGGNPTVMNKDVYLRAMGFERVLGIEDLDVPQAERDSWGANDSISMNRLLRIMMSKPSDTPWYMGYQTISSHEPWDVPYHRLQDSVQNAFAYTDHCLGHFLDSLSHTPLWDNLLVVIFADHGITYGVDMKTPEFFHMPLLMVGGAVRKARVISRLTAQSDIAATLLSQLGVSHRDFPWSRNVLSSNYRYHFIYSNYPSGVLYKDDTGDTMTDLISGCVVNKGDEGDETGHSERMERINVMLQTSYARIP